jgi:hypothetical protein
MGKIAHVLSVAGNIAGNIVAPNIMAGIPGTELHNQVEGNQLTHRLNAEAEEESQNQSRDAGTQATQLANANEPQKTQDAHNLSVAQQGNLDSETTARNNPKPKYTYQMTDHGLMAIEEGTGKAQPVTLNGTPIGPKVQTKIAPLEVGGQEHSVLLNEGTGETIKDLGPTGQKPMQVHVGEGGTWSLAEDGQGKPELFNNKTGEVKPAPDGMQKPGTAAKQQAGRKAIVTAYQPTLDSAERMNVMTESYEKAVKDHDQQAMLNLLANHLGMTMGLQKGARMTKDIINEAKQSQPWLQGIQSKFDKDGYLSGVNLSPNQMRQMVDLGKSRYAEDAKKSRATGQYLGSQDDGPDRIPGQATMRYYLGQTNGDVQKAKQLATQDGWTVK